MRDSNNASPHVGEITGTAIITVTDVMLDEYLHAVGLPAELLPRAGDGARLLPPDMISKLTMGELHAYWVGETFGRSARRAKHALRLYRPLQVGLTLSAECRVTEIGEKKGKQLVVLQADYFGLDGAIYIRDTRSIIVLSTGSKSGRKLS